MCKVEKKMYKGVVSSALALTVLVGSVFAPKLALASDPSDCSGSQASVGVSVSPLFVTNGQSAVFTVTYRNDGLTGCSVSNAVIKGYCPDGSGLPTSLAVTYPTIPYVPGAGASGSGTPQFNVGTFSCVINEGTLTAAQGKATADGDLLGVETIPGGSSSLQTINVIVKHPCISITKQCTDGNCEDGMIAYNGRVLNCGDVGLINVQVTDVVDGISVVVTNVSGPLAPGGSFTYSSSYVATHSPSTNYATATATAQIVGGTYSDTASAHCTVSGNPAINVTKECNQAVSGGQIDFSGQVCNQGNITLYNVTVYDSQIGGNVLTIDSLAPSVCSNFSGSYLPEGCPSTNVVLATGTSSPLCGSQVVSMTATAIDSDYSGYISAGTNIGNVTANLTGKNADYDMSFSTDLGNIGNISLTNNGN